MEILRLIASFLGKDVDLNALSPLIDLLKGGFDLKSVISLLQNENFTPLVKTFFDWLNNKSPTDSVGQVWGLSPIASIADKDIVFVLNRYLSLEETYS